MKFWEIVDLNKSTEILLEQNFGYHYRTPNIKTNSIISLKNKLQSVKILTTIQHISPFTQSELDAFSLMVMNITSLKLAMLCAMQQKAILAPQKLNLI